MHSVSAQVIQRERFEIPVGEADENFEIFPANDQGLFLFRGFEGFENNALQLIYLDTTLTEKWSGYIPTDKNYIDAKTVFYDSSLYVLLRYKDYSRSDYQIVVADKYRGNYAIHQFRNFIPLQITTFKVTHQAALVGGYFNRVPVVIYFSFKDHSSRIAPGLFNEAGELIQIRTYDDDSFDVLVGTHNFKRQQTVIIRNYNGAGDLVKSISLHPEDNKHLIFGRSLKTSGDMQVVAGVYGKRQSEYSKGIFIAGIDPVGNDQIRYYSYADLENFFKFMRARREQRVKERIERRKIRGRKLRFNYRFIVHEIVPYKDQYIMLGEAFYPRYIYTDRPMYQGSMFIPAGGSYFGRGLNQNGKIFDGYYYTHAVVIGFDANGKLLWDNSFEINDVRTWDLEQFVKLDVREDRIKLLYMFNHAIRTKTIDDSRVVEGKSISPIQARINDTVKKNSTTNTELGYWYRHTFYASGIQQITRYNGTAVVTQRLFFVNKVTTP